jgi:hypothetical protein
MILDITIPKMARSLPITLEVAGRLGERMHRIGRCEPLFHDPGHRLLVAGPAYPE